MPKGMGFKAAAMSAGKGNYKKGAAIVAASSRNASPAAKTEEPQSQEGEVVPSFPTHTGLVIDKSKQEDGSWLVTIVSPPEPDRIKTLYAGPDETAAQREYSKWKKHYEERAEVEVHA